MGNGQHKHSNQRSKSHPNVSSIHRKSSTGTTSSLHDKATTASTPRDGMSRTASGSDINEKNYSLFFPLEKLAKILQHKTQQEFGINGIVQEVFVKYVFPQYPDLGNRLFMRMHKTAKAKTKHLGVTAFRQQCEIYLSVLDDALIHEHYVKMFIVNGNCAIKENTCSSSSSKQTHQQQQLSEDELLVMNTNGLAELLLTCFRIAIANYVASDVKSMHSNVDMEFGNTVISAETYCPYIKRTITSVTQSCFFTKDTLSVGFVCRWLEKNCPNLIMPLHRFCVHTLTTVYRTIESDTIGAGIKELQEPSASSSFDANKETASELLMSAIDQLKRSEKVIAASDHPPKSTSSDIVTENTLRRSSNERGIGNLMPLSQSWLLASALPVVFTRPQPSQAQRIQKPETQEPPESPTVTIPSINAPVASAHPIMSHLISTIPMHWSLLYDSQQHGVGSNRFLHHVIGYKGPTLCILHSKADEVFCLASPSEWRETHLYTGDNDCHIIQMLPKFSILQKGPKLLYLNTCMRGYPKGLRAGLDPRKPLISIDEHFEKIEYRGVSSTLFSIEVYGCGDKQIRDIQLDIKKWQVTEAERQRTVKLTSADWIDHPDRYLLELGGRPQYNNS